MSSNQQKHIIILGAGVTGLQTALSLLTTPSTSHFKITIIATHTPGDFSPEYTSPWAGGHWRSHASSSPEEKEVTEWDARTYEFWSGLIWGKEVISPVVDGVDEELEKARRRMRVLGLGEKESRNYWGKEGSETKPGGSGLWWKSTVSNFQILDLEAERKITDPPVQTVHYEHGPASGGIPAGAVFGIKYKSICIDVPTYLLWLFSTVTSLGADVLKNTIDTSNALSGIVAAAKSTVRASNNDIKEENILALINCTGLSARKFLEKEEAEKLYPIRGQTILVKGECALARTYTHLPPPHSDDELTYIIPRPGSGTTILGGCKQAGNWSSEVDDQLSERILARVREWGLAEELRTGPGGAFEVVSTQVGFRPGRRGGPRVEVEGRVQGVWVVHSYGHAGAGYQNSVGSAEKVVGLIEGL